MNSNAEASSAESQSRRILGAVRSHRAKIGVLTAVALIFGIVSIVASLVVIGFYPSFAPRQEECLRVAEILARPGKTPPPGAAVPTGPRNLPLTPEELLYVEIEQTQVLSMATGLIAVSVALLGLGVLVLLSVLLLTRRATMNQIRASLAQISRQLEQLEKPRDGAPGADA